MTLLQKLSLAATLGSATFSVAASIPKDAQKTILPDNVVRCEPSAGCINKTLFGRSYKVITTPRFTVMVAISHEGIYTRADVSIANHTDTSLNMSPEDFRVEVLPSNPPPPIRPSPHPPCLRPQPPLPQPSPHPTQRLSPKPQPTRLPQQKPT